MQTKTKPGGLPPVNTIVTVRTDDGYTVTGRLLGLMRDVNGPKIRVLPADGLERRVPAPAAVTAV